MKNNAKDFNKKQFITGAILVFAINFLFFLYAPMEMFFLNKKDLFLDTWQIVGIVMPLFVVGTGIGVLILFVLNVINEKAGFVGIVIYFVAYVCTYVQGTFLLKNIPYMNGRNVEWNSLIWGRLESYVLWVIIIGIVLFLIKRFGKDLFGSIVRYFSVFLSLVLMVTWVTLFVQSKSYLSGDVVATSKNMFNMSSDKNFIILVLDSINAKMANHLFDEKPEYAEVFEDFTFYPDMIGAYGETRESVTFILSGDWYENDEEYSEYRIKAYENSPLFGRLEELGYTMGLYTDELAFDKGLVERFDNVSELEQSVSSYWGAAGCMVKLAGYRYGFFDLKRFCDFNIAECYDYFTPKEYMHTVTDNVQFYDMLKTENFSVNDDAVFKYIHINGAHVPWNLTTDMEYVDYMVPYETMVEASFLVADKYIKQLKELGVYDNSVIVVMADHGYNMADPSSDLDHQTPFFAVKGIGEQHEFSISNAPVSFEDLQGAFLKLIDGASGDAIFDYQEGDERERRYLFFESGQNDYMIEFVQKGHAFDYEGFVPTGRIFE